MSSTVTRRTVRLPERPSLADLGIEEPDWRDLGPEFISSWGRPGGKFDPEHMTVYGKSGGGKTFFVVETVALRAKVRSSHTVFVATKKADKTIMRLHDRHGWPIVSDWPPGYGENQVIYWARGGLEPEQKIRQRAKVRRLMEELWKANSNTVVVWDELGYLQSDLRLGTELETFYREGRSNGITNVALMQRPSKVTRLSHSEAGWTVAFPPKDVDDRRRVAEVLGDRARFTQALDALDRTRHQFLIRHDRSGEVYASYLPGPGRRADSTKARREVTSRQR